MATAKPTSNPRHIQITLLAKVLEQDNPTITSKMLPFLMQEGVGEVLINFITRVDPVLLPQGEDEVVKTKRANTAVSLFERQSSPIVSFLEKRADDVAACLFSALQHLTPDDPSEIETIPEVVAVPQEKEKGKSTASAPSTPTLGMSAALLGSSPGSGSGSGSGSSTPKNSRSTPGTPTLGMSGSFLSSSAPKSAPGTPSMARKLVPKFNEETLDLWRRTLYAVLTLTPVQAVEGLAADHTYMTGAVRVLGYDVVAQAILQIYATAASQPALGRKLTWFTWLLTRQLFSEVSYTCSACGEMLLNLIYTYSGSLKSAELAAQSAQPHSVHAFLQPFQSPEFLESLSKAVCKGGIIGTLCADILWKLTELEGTWPSRICCNSPALVQAIGQLDKPDEVPTENKWTPATIPPADLNPNKANASPTGKTKNKHKKKGSKSDGKKEDSVPPPALPSGTLTESTGELRAKLRGLGISPINNPFDKMSVVRCGVVKVLASCADIKVNGTYLTLDSLATDPLAWQVMSSWFLRFPYANIYHQQFYSIIKSAVVNKHWSCLRRLFVENKFLTTIVAHYQSPTKSGVKGYIQLICNDLLELYNEVNSASATTSPIEPQQSQQNKLRHKKKDSAAQSLQTSFVSFLELHEEWRKMEPELKKEVSWSSPIPERPPGGMGMGEMGGMGGMGMGGRGGGIAGFERDTIEEVLLDMPKFKQRG
eukprot:Phypoly_transcript_00544.p1 GENE.Phypoly_transcript_00544~~Phypoly_transcript_00544.p1  ORF type:complete len:708 (+),score=103.75 Phypoly_transcript_00544:2350-4473(+)